MSLLHRISPASPPPSIAQKGDLAILKERALQTILIVLCLAGIPALVLAAYEGVVQGNYFPVALYLGCYLLFLAILLARRLPYALRGAIVVATIYSLAVSELLSRGQLGEVRMFLIAFVALTSVLFGYRVIIFALLLSLITMIAPGIVASSNPNLHFLTLGTITPDTGWPTSGFVFLLVASTVAVSISTVISSLELNLLKQSQLAESLERERAFLEERIQDRNQSVARRLVQLRTAADISRTISALSDPDELLTQIVNVIRERFDLYYVGVFLLDTSREYAILQAGTGEAGKEMLLAGHRLSIASNSMVGWSITNRRPRIALDVGMEAIRFDNPHLPDTRSELALPIIAHEEVLGAITIQSDQPNAFDKNDIAILESVADSLAIALENDRLYQETRRSLDEIRALNREYLQRAWAETVETYGELAYQYENPLVPGKSPGHMVQVPLILRDEPIGYIELEINQPGLTDEENAFIDSVTTQTAIALENARLLQETERRAVQEQKLNELALLFSRAMNIDDILRVAAQELGQLPAVGEVSVRLFPDEGTGRPGNAPGQGSGGNGVEHSK